MRSRPSILILSMFSLFVAHSAHAQDLTSAESLLRGIYSGYRAQGEGFDLRGPKAGKILTPSLAALVNAHRNRSATEVGEIDGDFICDCQDFDIRSVLISVKPEGSGKATATAMFKNQGRATKVSFDLVTIDGKWRIDDIRDDGTPSLRKALISDLGKVGGTVIVRRDELDQSLGKNVVLVGTAENTKLSAAVVVDDSRVYCVDLSQWPADRSGKSIAVHGTLEQTNQFAARTGSGGEISQGTDGSDYVLRNCKLVP